VATKDYHFSVDSLLQLLVHYTDGSVPMNGEVLEMKVHRDMARKVGLVVRSHEWTEETPLFLGYDGRRTMSWYKGSNGDPVWEQKNDTPTRQ
jgi:hypothetical protein